MDLSTVLSFLAVLAAIGFPLLARRDLLTKLEERDKTREEWRADLNKKVDAFANNRYSTDFAALQAMDKERERSWWDWRRDADARLQRLSEAPFRIEQLEKHHAEYRDWKHEKVDPYINDYANLEKRVTRIENRLNGQMK
jgi:hypothetical protein